MISINSEITLYPSNSAPVTTLQSSNQGLFDISDTGSLTLLGVTLRDAIGAAITTDGTLIANDCVFENNHNPVDGGAVAIGPMGSGQFTRCDFRNNSGGLNGGGAVRVRNLATFDECTFVDNFGALRGGALVSLDGADLTVRNSYFEGNSTRDGGGAIFAFEVTTFAISNSVFYANEAPFGGAIYFVGTSTGTIDHTTFVNNESRFGGGAIRFASGPVTMNNSLLAGNIASVTTSRSACEAPLGAFGSNNVIEGSGCNFVGVNNQIGVPAHVGFPATMAGASRPCPFALAALPLVRATVWTVIRRR